jgi:hypothetical protein
VTRDTVGFLRERFIMHTTWLVLAVLACVVLLCDRVRTQADNSARAVRRHLQPLRRGQGPKIASPRRRYHDAKGVAGTYDIPTKNVYVDDRARRKMTSVRPAGFQINPVLQE